MIPAMTPEEAAELAELAEQTRIADATAERLRQQRNDLLIAHLDAGVAQADLARATGLNRDTIRRMVRAREKTSGK